VSESAVKALVFDVFGTVVDWRTSVAGEVNRLAAAKGWTVDGYAFADRWRGLYQPSMRPVRRGEAPYRRLDDLHRESLTTVLEEFELSLDDPEEREHLNRVWHRLTPWPDSVPGLNRLKSRYIIATLSNGNVSLMVNMAKHAGLPWDMILGAEPAQNYKPKSVVYLTAADWLDLEPAEIIMTAAHNHDLEAARKLGFRTAFIARPTEYGPHQDRDFKAESDWAYIVDSMEQLADALGC